MTSRKTVLYAAVLAGALTLGLSGCNGGEKEPTATASPTGSASSTVSPSPTSSGSGTGSGTPSPSVSVSVPAAARAHTEAGGIAFATWALGQADYGYVLADPSTFASVSDPSCGGCNVVVDGIKKLKASGYHQKSPSLRVDYSGAIKKSQDSPTVELFVTQAAVPMVHTSGAEAGGPKASKFKTQFTLEWADSGWKIREMVKS